MAIHLVKALKNRRHVVLESPTGTGKSAAILCSVLAWQRWHQKRMTSNCINEERTTGEVGPNTEINKPPTIIYCSRTHSQVTQMIASLRKTPYRPKMAVLGSRQRLCINAKVRDPDKNNNINKSCRIRVDNTEKYRRKLLNDPLQHYDDEDPPEALDQDALEQEEDRGEVDTDWTQPQSTTPMCSHYRQLGPSRTAKMAWETFVPAPDRINSCDCGGERTQLGTHDIEDLVKFGQDPYKKRNVAVYRRDTSQKFGMSINPDGQRRMRVSAVAVAGAVAKEGTIKVQDEIMAINGKSTMGRSLDQVCMEIGQSSDPLLMDVTSHPDKVTRADDEVSLHAPCPYYLSRALAKHAELIFCPYNYVLDPFIRKSLDINVQGAIVVLDEAHNVEDVLRDSGSGKFGEIEMCEMVVMLNTFAAAEKNSRNLVDLVHGEDVDLVHGEDEKVDISILAHDLLVFVEKLICFLISEKLQFENGPKSEKALADWRKFKGPDDQEFEMTFDGPTGHGSGGKTRGCQPFFDRIGLNASQGDHYRKLGEGLDSHIRSNQGRLSDKYSNLMDKLNELIMVVSYALENSEHYYIASVAQANGTLEFASGSVGDSLARRGDYGNPRQPKKMPLAWPRTHDATNLNLHPCLHPACRQTKSGPNYHEGYVRHGNYCNGSTHQWEAHLVVNLLTPARFMKDLSEQCRSVILASGSLAPLPSLCAELGLEGHPADGLKPTACMNFTTKQKEATTKKEIEDLRGKRLQVIPKPLEANHIIDLEKQLLAVSIGYFRDGSPLTVNFKNQSQSSFMPKLGDAIASCVEAIPTGGVLVFLPSYKTLNACVKKWGGSSRQNQWGGYTNYNENDHSDIWDRLIASKGKVVVEPTGSQDQFEAARDEYAETIKRTGKCILFAVFRGKMSEGISFNDANARCVICVGIPFPNSFDRAITAKKKYNDEQRTINKKHDILPGDQWYLQQAYRAIAQALGRCIRHAADYGTIILMDSRHCDDGSPIDAVCPAHRNLPKWMRHHVRNLSKGSRGDPSLRTIPGGWPGLKSEMTRFFQEAPIHTKAVLIKQKEDFNKAQMQQSAAHKFNHNTGQWASPSAIPDCKSPFALPVVPALPVAAMARSANVRDVSPSQQGIINLLESDNEHQ